MGQPARSVMELWPNPGETGRPRPHPPKKRRKTTKIEKSRTSVPPNETWRVVLAKRRNLAKPSRPKKARRAGGRQKEPMWTPNPAIVGPQPLVFAQPERVLAKPLSIAGAPRPPACFVPKFPALTLLLRSRVDARGTEPATPQASVLAVSGSCWGYFRPFDAGVFSVERLLSFNARSKCSRHERAHEGAVLCGQFIVLLMPELPSWAALIVRKWLNLRLEMCKMFKLVLYTLYIYRKKKSEQSYVTLSSCKLETPPYR